MELSEASKGRLRELASQQRDRREARERERLADTGNSRGRIAIGLDWREFEELPDSQQAELLRGGAERVDAADAAALVRGYHYTEWAATVDELKRLGLLDEALELLDEIIDAVRKEAELLPERGGAPPGWWQKAAVVARKMKNYALEVAYLEDLSARPDHNDPYGHTASRLAKARQLLAAQDIESQSRGVGATGREP